MRKIVLGLAVFLLLIGGLVFIFKDQVQRFLFKPTSTNIQTGVSKDSLKDEIQTTRDKTETENIKVIAQDLNIPWEIVFISGTEMLVTERPGNLLKITISGDRSIVQKIEGVAHVGEGGLMGMALHPDFESNKWIYLYLTTITDAGLTNRVERYVFEGNKLYNRTVIIENIPGAQFHDGGRMEFGPDGYLYITTGDAGNQESAQGKSSLSGKILRLVDDGSNPSDNPFANAIYSYGHRNSQGLAWDDRGNLWSTEHGPSGFQTGYDELNLIEKGANYGWPQIKGDETSLGMTAPIIQSGSDDTWAPAGAAFVDGSVFFAGLRGEALYEAKIDGGSVVDLKAHFKGEFGRLRAVVLGPDGHLYVTTSNTDGRGDPTSGDDKILRINPEIFN